MSSFHLSLAAARINAGLTQKQASNLLEVGVNTLINWETEKTYPDAQKLQKISTIYNVPVKFLIKEPIKLGTNEYKEITVTKEDELIASITADEVITKEGYKVMCVPAETSTYSGTHKTLVRDNNTPHMVKR